MLSGQDFNIKIKQLAENTNSTYSTEDTNITIVQRYSGVPTQTILNAAEIVSTNDSNTNTYA